MNNFKKIKNMSEDELTNFLDNNYYEDTEWNNWFNKTYCNTEKCPSIETKYVDINGNNNICECAYCEINNRCRFFDFIPTSKDIIKLWLKESV